MGEFTNGPWFYRKSEGGSDYAVYSDWTCKQESMLTYGGCGCCNESDESIESEDDARLMAAAPDLLEALEDMCAEFRALDLPYGSAAYCKANSLINKVRARGEA